MVLISKAYVWHAVLASYHFFVRVYIDVGKEGMQKQWAAPSGYFHAHMHL